MDAMSFRRLLFALSVLPFLLPWRPVAAAGVWGTRPLLSYFALTASLEAPLQQGARLTAYELRLIVGIALQEAEALQRLERLSQPLVADPLLSLAEKQRRIAALGYNRQVDAILYATDRRLRYSLSESAYRRLVGWIERRWPWEQMSHGLARARWLSSLAGVRSYQVFATRYDSKGRYTVALPDQCLKFANGGLHLCDSKGYTAGAGYSVAISYKSGLGVMVGESGPWNIEDNYWASLADPQPRRMFADLPLGMPEAQAAYFSGYNGGKDQYGRKVSGPFAIDLAFAVGDDIGLPAKKNDWITVSYLWTKDWGGKPGKQAGNTPGATAAPGIAPTVNPELLQAIQLATPAADGSITHLVKSGQTLWAIAVAYQVRVAQLQFLNNLGQTVIIYTGQKLKIKDAGPTWTPLPGTADPNITNTPPAPTETPTPPLPVRQTQKAARRTVAAAAAASLSETPHAATPTFTVTSLIQRAASLPTESTASAASGGLTNGLSGGDWGLLIGALILGLGGILLFGLGWLFGARRGKKPKM